MTTGQLVIIIIGILIAIALIGEVIKETVKIKYEADPLNKLFGGKKKEEK